MKRGKLFHWSQVVSLMLTKSRALAPGRVIGAGARPLVALR
jgi:hypothetical protein